jgi:hypothetical protein
MDSLWCIRTAVIPTGVCFCSLVGCVLLEGRSTYATRYGVLMVLHILVGGYTLDTSCNAVGHSVT